MVEQIYRRVSIVKNIKFMNSLPDWRRHRQDRSRIGWFQREINHGLYIPNIAEFLLVPSWLQRKALVGWYEYCCMLQQLKNNKTDQVNTYMYIFNNSLDIVIYMISQKKELIRTSSHDSCWYGGYALIHSCSLSSSPSLPNGAGYQHACYHNDHCKYGHRHSGYKVCRGTPPALVVFRVPNGGGRRGCGGVCCRSLVDIFILSHFSLAWLWFFFLPLLQYLMSSSKCIVFFECTMISHVSSDPSFSHTSPLDTELKKWAKYHLLTKN